jgi:hypothetical protein
MADGFEPVFQSFENLFLSEGPGGLPSDVAFGFLSVCLCHTVCG